MAVEQTLSVEEKGCNEIENESSVRIIWNSQQTGLSWNGFTQTAYYYVSINGEPERTYSVTYTLPSARTVNIVDKTIYVKHKDNGSGSVKVRTWMDTGISAGVIELQKSITLTSIPRPSSLSYVSDVTLGEICTVKWTPMAKDLHFKIKFSVGDWSLTTAVIHPNTTTLYTNASYPISLEAAHQFPNSKDADMTVTLYTYRDEGGTDQVGEASTKTCKVYIPENENTLPTVAMALTPVSSLPSTFNGLYIQNKTKVQADFTGSKAKYSASISSYSMDVNGKTYESPYLSDLLSTSGTISVKGTAVDSRGCSASSPQDITVIPYSKPSIIPYNGESSIICKRCNSDGGLSATGTCLRIKAGRKYSKVVVDGVQKNFCLMQVKYKAETASSWGTAKTILSKDNKSDSVDITLADINLALSATYLVQIDVVDDIGETYSMVITIPTADCTYHLRKGGKGIAIGKYAEEDYIFDIDDEWTVYVRGSLKANHIEHIPAIDNYSSKDFNELIYNTGYYTGTAVPSAASCSNYPDNETGLLEVVSAMKQNATTLVWWGFAYQTYRTHTGKVYMRSYYSDTGWTAWKQVTLT